MSPVSFTKKLRNESYHFESHVDEEGNLYFRVKCQRLGRPFLMIMNKEKKWVIREPQDVWPEILELEDEFSKMLSTHVRNEA